MRRYLEILKLVWPLALGMINNAVMQFVDRAFLAKDSLSSIEAVLPACTLAWVFMGFFQSVVGYTGVFVSQYHGSGEDKKCRESYRAGLAISIIAGVASLALVPVGGWIFSLTAPSAEIVAKESAYYDIVILGSFFLYGQMASISYFTGRGNTRVVFWVNLFGNLLNILFDYLMIFGFDVSPCVFGRSLPLRIPPLGISGAAYATVLAQFFQFAVLLYLSRDVLVRKFVLNVCHLTLRSPLIVRILRYGIPSGGYEILNMLSFTIFVFVTGRSGDLAFAVSNACFTINYLLFAPMMGFAIGAQTLVGQAIGRGSTADAESDFRRTAVLGLAFVFVTCAAAVVCHRQILSLFVSEGVSAEAFYSLGFKLLVCMACWLLFDALDVILSGALKGAGDTKFVFFWMLVNSFGIWLPLVFVVNHFTSDIISLWYTMIVYVVIICSGSFIRWHLGRWKSIRIK